VDPRDQNRNDCGARPQIAVIGPGDAGPVETADADKTGRVLAREGAVLLCGGRGGVMEAACRGAREEGGMTVGILPDTGNGNPYLSVVIRTGLGNARNAVLIQSADAVVALGGGYGTLSEIALALKGGREVFGVKTWKIDGVVTCETPDEAVLSALTAARRSPWCRSRQAGREYP
jgi:uncharacterized protein (TIGR00725 family)